MQLSPGSDFPYRCPHCQADRMTFGHVAAGEITPAPQQGHRPESADVPRTRQAMAICRNPDCRKMVIFDLLMSRSVTDRGIIHIQSHTWHVTGTSPAQKRPLVSELLPPQVRQCMLEAEEVLMSGPSNLARIARGAYRTVLDVATKEVLAQNLHCLDGQRADKITLYRRIDLLTEHHLLTPALRDWAHSVRVVTNEDVHTVESVIVEEAQEVAEITRMILLYLFEMPARVRLAREAAQAKSTPAQLPALH